MIHFTNINGERLPEDVNKIANETWDKEGFKGEDIEGEGFPIVEAFYFHNKKESSHIWWQVYEGNYEPLREFHNL